MQFVIIRLPRRRSLPRWKARVISVAFLMAVAQIYAQTQAEMNAQARADFARADADLNKTYHSVLAKLPTAQGKQELREAQRAWIASRAAEAASAAGESEGGSMAPTLRYEAMTQLTRQRIKELKAKLDHRNESGPTPAAANVTPSHFVTLEPVQHEPQTVGAESPVNAQQSATVEGVRDVSPDGRFAMGRSNDNAVKLVSLPSKKIVIDLRQIEAFDLGHLIWSQDSNWFSFCYSNGPRVTNTYVYHRTGDTFSEVDLEDPLDLNGEEWGELVVPVRWLKPGVLSLKGSVTYRDGKVAGYRFTDKFDEKSGRFQIISKKKVATKE